MDGLPSRIFCLTPFVRKNDIIFLDNAGCFLLECLYAWTDHFTIFNYDVEDYAAPGNIDVEGFQVASFTGAATYELPLELPDGAGGFKPDLTLRYNSQIVDMNRIRKQGAWVGKGCSPRWVISSSPTRRS